MGCCGLSPFSLGRKPVSGTFYCHSGISGSIKTFQPALCSVQSQLLRLLCSRLTLCSMVCCTAQHYTVLQSTECHSLNAQNNEALKTRIKRMLKSITITKVNQYVKHEGNKQIYSRSKININSLSGMTLVKILQANQFAKNERPERTPRRCVSVRLSVGYCTYVNIRGLREMVLHCAHHHRCYTGQV